MGNQVSTSLTPKEIEVRLQYLDRGKEIVPENNAACQLVKQKFLDPLRTCNLSVARRFCAADGASVIDNAEYGIPLWYLMDLLQGIDESFPDCCFTFDEMREISPGAVKVSNFYMQGTHTRKPFSIGEHPAVPPSGRRIRDDPYDFVVYVDNGKMKMINILGHGKLVGPYGFYVKTGGKMSMTQPPKHVVKIA
eukprot:Nitzschia sp. Nitz4//scaffold241_size29735//14592//15170//NITZ4_008027-RA/size29735-processed-gene-0.13-mRNA-1//-1//CDS//3329543778//9341//frame0